MAARQPLGHGLLLLTVAAKVVLVPADGCRSGTVVKQATFEASVGSSVKLHCAFDLKGYQNGLPNNTAVIWKRKEELLVEVTIPNSKPKFWGDWSRRIDVLPKDGSFPIVIKKLQLDDVGDFSCNLYEGINCLMETWQISLTNGTLSGTNWHPHLAGIVSGVCSMATLLLIAGVVVVVVHRKRAQHVEQPPPHPEYKYITYPVEQAQLVEHPPPHPEYQYITYPVQKGLEEIPPHIPEYEYIRHPASKGHEDVLSHKQRDHLKAEVIENPIYVQQI
ncbi:uncharacterized protein LOC144822446 isoform X2 [Lissotriton helveticus]